MGRRNTDNHGCLHNAKYGHRAYDVSEGDDYDDYANLGHCSDEYSIDQEPDYRPKRVKNGSDECISVGQRSAHKREGNRKLEQDEDY